MSNLLTRPARHLALVPDTREIVEQHPSWCESGPVCGDHHTGDAAGIVPATAGGFRVEDDAAAFPMAEVYALLDAGIPAVALQLSSPLIEHDQKDSLTAYLPADSARDLISAVFDAVCGGPTRTIGSPSLFGPLTVTVAAVGDVVRLTVSDDEGTTVTADMRLDEARKLADGIGHVVDVVTAPVSWVETTLTVGGRR